MKIINKRFFLIAILIVNYSMNCLSQQSINLLKLTINDTISLTDLNIERTTNLLGRPSAVQRQPDFLADILGSCIYYHDLGLEFWYHTKKIDPQERVYIISIYLVKTWHKDFSKFYLPFGGILSPELTPNMKINDIKLLFEKDSVSITTAADSRSQIDAMKKKGDWPTGVNPKNSEDILSINNGNIKINFFCEELTKYLERITIIFNR